MASITLDKDYSATYVPYQHGPCYVAKGIVFYREKPVRIFEAYGPTIPDTEKAAREKAAEIHAQLIKGAGIKG
ncbi:MAG TPA: hypothetical protein VKB67_11385 [Rhizomicrobium sp.]|nr:hypothetical protein [Rhizomicrobium sp.]